LFPQFTLHGSYGGQSDQFSNLFDNPIWSVGANLTQPLFHGGTLTAERRAALAAFDAARHDYRQTVLNAFKNVADAMQAVYADAEALNALHVALNSSEESLGLTEQQYRLGGVGYVGVLVVQRQAYQARINYVQRLASRYQNTAALMHALGGGWSAETDLDVFSSSTPSSSKLPAAADNGTTAAIPATATQE
jgi:outer membrane protein TolC